MKTVPRIGRMLDLAGLLLFLGGGATFAWSWMGFRGLTRSELPADGPAGAAVAIADGYWRLQKIGGGLMLAGIAVFVIAWWVARVAARRDASEAAARDASAPRDAREARDEGAPTPTAG